MSCPKPAPTPLRDVVDGIPDRASSRPLWKYVLIATAFAAWVGALLTVYLVARPR